MEHCPRASAGLILQFSVYTLFFISFHRSPFLFLFLFDFGIFHHFLFLVIFLGYLIPWTLFLFFYFSIFLFFSSHISIFDACTHEFMTESRQR